MAWWRSKCPVMLFHVTTAELQGTQCTVLVQSANWLQPLWAPSEKWDLLKSAFLLSNFSVQIYVAVRIEMRTVAFSSTFWNAVSAENINFWMVIRFSDICFSTPLSTDFLIEQSQLIARQDRDTCTSLFSCLSTHVWPQVLLPLKFTDLIASPGRGDFYFQTLHLVLVSAFSSAVLLNAGSIW